MNECKEKGIPTFGTAQERKDRLKRFNGTESLSCNTHYRRWRSVLRDPAAATGAAVQAWLRKRAAGRQEGRGEIVGG